MQQRLVLEPLASQVEKQLCDVCVCVPFNFASVDPNHRYVGFARFCCATQVHEHCGLVQGRGMIDQPRIARFPVVVSS